MANLESPTPLDSSEKEKLVPTQTKLAELNESRTELLSRIQSLKQDLQIWRSKLDTQVQTYRSDLVELRKSLNVEVDQLRSEFQDLRTTLQQQQEDVTVSLRNLGLQDPPKDTGTFTGHGVNDKVDNAEENGSGRSNEETTVDESSAKANGIEVHSSTAVEVDN